MWCPPEYVHICEVIEDCKAAAWEILPYTPGNELNFSDELNDELDLDYDYENSPELKRLAIVSKLYELFFGRYPRQGFASSTDGRVIRLEREVFRPVLFNHRMEYSKNFCRLPTLMFVNTSLGVIDLEGVPDRISEVSDWDATTGWVRDAIGLLGPLDGWSVCFPRTTIGEGKAAMLELWDARQGQPESSVGRPREREKVALAYKKHFPQGHEAMSQKDVLKVLRDREGIVVSTDTLRRALGLRD